MDVVDRVGDFWRKGKPFIYACRYRLGEVGGDREQLGSLDRTAQDRVAIALPPKDIPAQRSRMHLKIDNIYTSFPNPPVEPNPPSPLAVASKSCPSAFALADIS